MTEVYVYGKRGGTYSKIVTEKENIGPGTSYDLTVSLAAGPVRGRVQAGPEGRRHQDADHGHRPGRLRAATTDPAADAGGRRPTAPTSSSRPTPLVPLVDAFVAAVKAGDVEKAKSAVRRVAGPAGSAIEPVAESFGDLDPRVDLREADLEAGQEWTGWHRLEKALWTDGDLTGLAPVADQLAPTYASCRAGRHRRPVGRLDRQRRQGAARRGGHRQDHRRGGGLLAHRPGRLPGQPRRRQEGLRRCSARWSSDQRPAGPPGRRVRRRQQQLDGAPRRRHLRVLRHRDEAAAARAGPGRRRRSASRCRSSTAAAV